MKHDGGLYRKGAARLDTLIILELLPRVVFTVVKAILEPMWEFGSWHSTCSAKHHSMVVINKVKAFIVNQVRLTAHYCRVISTWMWSIFFRQIKLRFTLCGGSL